MECDKDSIGRLISIIHRQIGCHISKELEQYDLGSPHFQVILMLYTKDGISQEELTRHFKKDKGTIARTLKKLEENGLVERKVNPEDKRAYEIYLTPKALEIKPMIKEVLINTTKILELGITDEEKEMFINVLKKMVNNAVTYFKEE